MGWGRIRVRVRVRVMFRICVRVEWDRVGVEAETEGIGFGVRSGAGPYQVRPAAVGAWLDFRMTVGARVMVTVGVGAGVGAVGSPGPLCSHRTLCEVCGLADARAKSVGRRWRRAGKDPPAWCRHHLHQDVEHLG